MNHQPISLGELIDALALREQTQNVYFDFGGMVPCNVDSYRGYYDHLAIGHNPREAPAITVAKLLADLRGAVGTVYGGYKGGDFRMSKSTPVWVANWGESDSTAVIGIAPVSWTTIIATGYCDNWDGGAARALQVLSGLGYGNAHLPTEEAQ